jgi:hypothetical protein
MIEPNRRPSMPTLRDDMAPKNAVSSHDQPHGPQPNSRAMLSTLRREHAACLAKPKSTFTSRQSV